MKRDDGAAALLREARAGEYKCPECGCLTIWAADQYKADILAEVRRTVEFECPPETDILDTYEEGAYKTCKAILRRLEKLT